MTVSLLQPWLELFSANMGAVFSRIANAVIYLAGAVWTFLVESGVDCEDSAKEINGQEHLSQAQVMRSFKLSVVHFHSECMCVR